MTHPFPIAIVGAGFSGLAMALAARRHGLDQDLVIFEAAERLGGTWRDNTYPGCACDVPSHLYSLRDAPNPDWSRTYGGQAEILAYMEAVADAQGLKDHIRFQTRVQRADWDGARGLWVLSLDDGGQHEARALILALGPLAIPNIPDFPGAETFEGAAFHTQRWDHSVELAGKRVAVIGTGASAIQVVPAIADQVAHLDLYQRTPAWIISRSDRTFSPFERTVFRSVPGARWLYRNLLFAIRELVFAPALTRNGLLTRAMTALLERNLRVSVADPDLRERLRPSYTPGCKRIIVSDDYYPALQRDTVHLVDQAVRAITPTGVVGADGVERPADVIVYATGFKPTEFLSKIEIQAGEATVQARWEERVEALHGTCIAGFPNLFLMLGPNTGLGHNSVILMAEAQADYTAQCLRRIRDGGLLGLEVRPEVQSAHQASIERALRRTVWLSGCASWYQAGGSSPILWPDSVWAFQRRLARPRWSDFIALHPER